MYSFMHALVITFILYHNKPYSTFFYIERELIMANSKLMVSTSDLPSTGDSLSQPQLLTNMTHTSSNQG